MQHARRAGAIRTTIAVILLLLGLAAIGLWRVLSGTGGLPYAAGASPPRSAHVSAGRSYTLAVPGGVRAMLAHGVPVAGSSSAHLISLQCTWTSQTTSQTTSQPTSRALGGQALTVSAESTSTKAENTVGHFVSPTTGKIGVDCAGWGSMFIPDSDDRSADLAGWALLSALVALSVGAPLAVSQLRQAWAHSRVAAATGPVASTTERVTTTPGEVMTTTGEDDADN